MSPSSKSFLQDRACQDDTPILFPTLISERLVLMKDTVLFISNFVQHKDRSNFDWFEMIDRFKMIDSLCCTSPHWWRDDICWNVSNISWQENQILLIKSKLFKPCIKIPYVLFILTLSISKTQFWYLQLRNILFHFWQVYFDCVIAKFRKLVYKAEASW